MSHLVRPSWKGQCRTVGGRPQGGRAATRAEGVLGASRDSGHPTGGTRTQRGHLGGDTQAMGRGLREEVVWGSREEGDQGSMKTGGVAAVPPLSGVTVTDRDPSFSPAQGP